MSQIHGLRTKPTIVLRKIIRDLERGMTAEDLLIILSAELEEECLTAQEGTYEGKNKFFLPNDFFEQSE